MTYLLFVDDERQPWSSIEDEGYRASVGLPPLERSPLARISEEWVVVRSVAEAIAVLHDRGMPAYVAFDHDLGDQVPTGHDLAKSIVEMDMDGVIEIPIDFRYEVHSANPVGRENIRGLLDNYLQFRAGQEHGR